jgi:DNA-binding transcriptional LysR family regulator
MNITLRQLRAFVLLAETGSFTQAARAMHVTQSALSLLVRELEGGLKSRLVNRTTRSISLTEVGQEFLPTAQRVLDDLQHAVGHVDKLLAKQRGRVVVAAPLVLSGTFLPPLLARFIQRYPGVEVVLKDSLPDEVLPRVHSGAADLGIGTFRQMQQELEQVLLFKESMMAVMPRTHALASGKARLTWRDLQGVPVLALPRSSVFRELAEAGFAACGLQLQPAFEATYVGTLVGMVKAGLGVAIMPGYSQALGDPATLRWRRLERPVVEREVLMVHRRDRALSPAAQALQDHILASRPGTGARRKRGA